MILAYGPMVWNDDADLAAVCRSIANERHPNPDHELFNLLADLIEQGRTAEELTEWLRQGNVRGFRD